MEEEVQKFQQDRACRNKFLLERQAKELEEFDLKTTTMGLDAMHIAEVQITSTQICFLIVFIVLIVMNSYFFVLQVAQNTYHDDEDNVSVRGSVLSLTPSSSSSSFSATQL